MRDVKFYNEEYCMGNCCFVLSTGRCGTTLLARIFDLSDEIISLHEPMPTLSFAPNLIYHCDSNRHSELKAMFYAARAQTVHRICVKMKKIYTETNHNFTFFAHIILDMFPNAKFIHLIRHPGDFIHSGMRRSWYVDNPDQYRTQLFPREDSDVDFAKMERIEKIAWLWQETNEIAEHFMLKISDYPGKSTLVKSEDLWKDPETSIKLFKFIGTDPPETESIRSIISTKVNPGPVVKFPEHKDWARELKNRIIQLTPLARRYGYEW